MPPDSAFHRHRDQLERSELQYGPAAGRLAVSLDLLTDALVLVGQHGVYCQSARTPGTPALDLQHILLNLEHAKELLASAFQELRPPPAGGSPVRDFPQS